MQQPGSGTALERAVAGFHQEPQTMNSLLSGQTSRVMLGTLERHQITSKTAKCAQCGECPADWLMRRGQGAYTTSCSDPGCLGKAEKQL